MGGPVCAHSGRLAAPVVVSRADMPNVGTPKRTCAPVVVLPGANLSGGSKTLSTTSADDEFMPPSLERSYDLRTVTKATLGVALSTVMLIRCLELVQALRQSDERPLLAFPLSAVLPALLVIALAIMPPAVSREGALMRLGTMVQCVLIIAVPRLALHLALGLPVVFLLVELFETRCPSSLREAVTRRLLK